MAPAPTLQDIASSLFAANVIKIGKFTLKSGDVSPIYFDFRTLVSFPTLMKDISNLLVQKLKECPDAQVLCGVPYTALPFATIVSLETKLPMVIRRKEKKTYGTENLIEGITEKGQNCVIIEDVITTGSSVLTTRNDLVEAGLNVTDAVILLDRKQGGSDNLKNRGIRVHSLFTIEELLKMLLSAGKITSIMADSVHEYIRGTNIQLKDDAVEKRICIPFEERAKSATNPIASKLFSIMSTKKTNLCLAADVEDKSAILKLLKDVGPHICMFKLHADIISNFDEEFAAELAESAQKHNVILMEDRKFGDIGNTVSLQCRRICKWAQAVTAHSLPGPGVVEGILSGYENNDVGVFIVAEMSCKENLINEKYTETSLKLSEKFKNAIAGVVCQNDIFNNPALIQMTPGVNIHRKGDDLGQTFNTPEEIVKNRGADIAVVGRGIIQADDPISTAILYKTKLWESYLARVKSS